MSRHDPLTIAAAAVFTVLCLAPARAVADDPPAPSQALASDPAPPFPRLGLSADGAAIAFADYALRLDAAPERWGSAWISGGISRRHGGESILVEGGVSIWPLAWGMEGLWISPAVGVAFAGPWNGDNADARSVLRFGGDVGWQFVWGDLSISFGAGATGFASLDGTGEVWVEPRFRGALGIVWR
jgi:hypothetical protein